MARAVLRFSLLLIILTLVFASPQVQTRSQEKTSEPGESKDHPIVIKIDVTNHLPISEGDCLGLLCTDGWSKSRVFQKVDDPNHDKNQNRIESGAAAKIFVTENLKKYGTIRFNDKCTTAEEIPYAMTKQGGGNAWLMSAPLDMQRSQGGTLKKSTDSVKRGKFYTWTYETDGSLGLGPWCTAYNKNDVEKCEELTELEQDVFGLKVILSKYLFTKEDGADKYISMYDQKKRKRSGNKRRKSQ